MKDETSITAFDKDDKLIGVRIGTRKRRSDWFGWMFEKGFNLLPTRIMMLMMPAGMEQMPIAQKLFIKADYDVWHMFGYLGCDLIYEDKAVCSSRFCGVKGLGTELCRRSEELARNLGCTHTYAAVTGNYSRKIFEKLGHTLKTEVVYADFKDENGEPYLKDTREHISLTTFFKKLA